MRHTESDRKAYNDGLKIKAHREKVAKWLADNPDIATLNSGKHYVYPAGGEYREVAEFEEIK